MWKVEGGILNAECGIDRFRIPHLSLIVFVQYRSVYRTGTAQGVEATKRYRSLPLLKRPAATAPCAVPDIVLISTRTTYRNSRQAGIKKVTG